MIRLAGPVAARLAGAGALVVLSALGRLEAHELGTTKVAVQLDEVSQQSGGHYRIAIDTDAESLLSQIKLSFQNGELTVAGPSHDDAAATYLLVRAPKAAALDLEVTNGPLSVYHVAGKITARAQNGPVSASGCTGELDLSAQNGPVSSEDNSGRLRLHAQNGPVSVSLRGDVWIGPSPGLEARAENGPVTLQIPRGYKSGVVVESTGRGPFSCASVCSEGRKSWDDDHKRVEFGSGPPMIRVSVGNGPVSVR